MSSLPQRPCRSVPLAQSWQLLFALHWTSLCSQDSSVKHFGWFCNEKRDLAEPAAIAIQGCWKEEAVICSPHTKSETSKGHVGRAKE